MRNLLILLLLSGSLATAQTATKRYVGGFTTFTIPFDDDSLTFAVVAREGELTKRKPIFLFRQGSLPIPLFTINPKNNRPSLTELPLVCYDHEADYNFIMIAKPGVPLVQNDAYLDTLFTTRHRPKPEQYTRQYFEHNYLDHYVRQVNAVLDFVSKQPWADPRRIVMAGGSEGYQVAIKAAHSNPRVTHLIAFSGGLQGRHQSIMHIERSKQYTGEYTPEEAQQSIEGLQQQWAEVCRDSLNTSAVAGDPNRTQYSFSHGNNLSYLLSLNIPIWIGYGTADVGAVSNDILPIEFARRGKANLTLRAYPAHDHTFYKLTYGPNGKVTNKTYNGDAVTRDYFEWLKRH
ncbi:MAG: hypothetical protein EAZ91_23310 [Cytophagales bacterium]|nr:MAG: hypothetical protein EAZ91_23310 [Cytophagales bacterium]